MKGTQSIAPIGPFPPRLYRAFTEEYWARQFMERGLMRFRPVQYFADLEDPIRADASEGHAHLQIPGNVLRAHLDVDGNVVGTSSAPGLVDYQATFVNRVYVYCFSYPPADDHRLLPQKFGRYVVRIDDPSRLAHDVARAMTRDALLRDTPVVECHEVLYNKGEVAPEETDHCKRVRLNFMQKPRQFAEEYEWRFAAVDGRMVDWETWEPLEDAYDVEIGAALPYTSLHIRW